MHALLIKILTKQVSLLNNLNNSSFEFTPIETSASRYYPSLQC